MLRGDPTRDGVTRGSLLGVACLLALGAFGLAFADALDGILEVHSAYVNIDKGVFMLHARVEYPVSPVIRSALRDGVTLTFDLEARVDRDRRYWLNSNIVDLTLRRELNYHARVDAWPILVEPQLDGGNYTISVRAGVRRGHLPASLRAILFWTDDWARVSEWYSWSLPV